MNTTGTECRFTIQFVISVTRELCQNNFNIIFQPGLAAGPLCRWTQMHFKSGADFIQQFPQPLTEDNVPAEFWDVVRNLPSFAAVPHDYRFHNSRFVLCRFDSLFLGELISANFAMRKLDVNNFQESVLVELYSLLRKSMPSVTRAWTTSGFWNDGTFSNMMNILSHYCKAVWTRTVWVMCSFDECIRSCSDQARFFSPSLRQFLICPLVSPFSLKIWSSPTEISNVKPFFLFVLFA